MDATLNRTPRDNLGTISASHDSSSLRLSALLYGIDFSKHFPQILDSATNTEVRVIDSEKAKDFLFKNFKTIYDSQDQPGSQENSLFPDPLTENKLRYYQYCSDFFGFYQGETLFGVFMGSPVDWGSYYFRNCSILPQYRGRGYNQTFYKYLLQLLQQYSLDRVEVDVSSANLANIHIFNKLQFNVTGYSTQDRWASLVHFTRFLNSKAEDIFLDRFCHGVKPQRQLRHHL